MKTLKLLTGYHTSRGDEVFVLYNPTAAAGSALERWFQRSNYNLVSVFKHHHTNNTNLVVFTQFEHTLLCGRPPGST